MPTFLTLTPNPALDLSTDTAQVVPTHKLRCGAVQRYPGGGGVNVARMLHRLGSGVQAWMLAGGVAGAQLQGLLAAEGVDTLCLSIAGDTRENLSVLDRSSALEYRFVLPGPALQAGEWQACLERLAALAPTPRWWVASGSLPPGVPQDFYARLARLARARGSRLALDSSGPALAEALQAGVSLVKPSLRELRELTGAALAEPAQWHAAARALVQDGRAEVVALSA
ncbi:1-phosphofructokinase family hexose kinase, partial [Acidovorax sp. SRB_24]|uniref:1-phosphofructokinase family hexose kinase n=1 Tax=Acidovorax sp. SRB_24 TaxID=1962700 RepID=UPI00145D4138